MVARARIMADGRCRLGVWSKGNQSVARRSARRPLRIHLHSPSTVPGSILSRAFFSKLARSVLRHIRVASQQELKQRIMAAMDEFNRHPVVQTWSYKLDHAA